MNRKYKIVYTTGAFDPFHFGHLNILRKAKSIADTLIVGISTDNLIEKSKSRNAFMTLDHRMNIIKELRCVDIVIPQVDKNKQKIVSKYNVDAIVVGSDWKGHYPEVSCEIIYVPYTEEISSSIIRDGIEGN